MNDWVLTRAIEVKAGDAKAKIGLMLTLVGHFDRGVRAAAACGFARPAKPQAAHFGNPVTSSLA